ncbi:hypothetical protein TTRE_0000863601 [Trichuris trichiura]|uniref:Uncharacterized protein n=1 Tax=Trichuris trichiura TaxID=36087 RepID=A0A077ZIQ2_TRITR|nr:hypothetical protein TTRE_0000863601 [Trichuris trichiura]
MAFVAASVLRRYTGTPAAGVEDDDDDDIVRVGAAEWTTRRTPAANVADTPRPVRRPAGSSVFAVRQLQDRRAAPPVRLHAVDLRTSIPASVRRSCTAAAAAAAVDDDETVRLAAAAGTARPTTAANVADTLLPVRRAAGSGVFAVRQLAVRRVAPPVRLLAVDLRTSMRERT